MTEQEVFSDIAEEYDIQFTDTSIGKEQRYRVWHYLNKSVNAKPGVLELNCGTGTDAIWMAEKGWNVLATDGSKGMIRVAEKKIRNAGLDSPVQTEVLSFDQLKHLPDDSFDLIFSNFGGLNCIPPDELKMLWRVLEQKLRPGGQIIAVIMGKFCWWETLYFLAKLNVKQAKRRWSKQPVMATLSADSQVKTWYYHPAKLHFPESWKYLTISTYPIGFWIPPSYLGSFFSKFPRILQLLIFLENHVTFFFFSKAADHFLIRISFKLEDGL